MLVAVHASLLSFHIETRLYLASIMLASWIFHVHHPFFFVGFTKDTLAFSNEIVDGIRYLTSFVFTRLTKDVRHSILFMLRTKLAVFLASKIESWIRRTIWMLTIFCIEMNHTIHFVLVAEQWRLFPVEVKVCTQCTWWVLTNLSHGDLYNIYDVCVGD